MITADSHKKFVPCITDAFTKYAVVIAIASKDAEMVVDAIYRDWYSKIRILAQILMDGGKEFVNKLLAERTSEMQCSRRGFQKDRQEVPSIFRGRHYT